MTATPCSSCPWRKSSTIGGYDIPGFSMEMMRGLSSTVAGPGDEKDDFRVIMACHGSTDESVEPCRGYLYVEGWTNLRVRVLNSMGEIDMEAVDEACQDLDLWPSFHDLLEAYENVRDD